MTIRERVLAERVTRLVHERFDPTLNTTPVAVEAHGYRNGASDVITLVDAVLAQYLIPLGVDYES